jgi:hypothetical protein
MQLKQPGVWLPETVSARLAAFKRDVVQALPGAVEAVILFGSRARGDATAESDFDIAVLLSFQLADDRDIRRRVADIAWEYAHADGLIQAVPLNADAFVPPRTELALRIATEGMVI